jgi:hypothetical protein
VRFAEVHLQTAAWLRSHRATIRATSLKPRDQPMPLAKQSERYSRWSMLVLESGAIPRSATRSATLASARLRVHPVDGKTRFACSGAYGRSSRPRTRGSVADEAHRYTRTPVAKPSLLPILGRDLWRAGRESVARYRLYFVGYVTMKRQLSGYGLRTSRVDNAQCELRPGTV